MTAATIPRNPTGNELVTVTVTFATALSAPPASAKMWVRAPSGVVSEETATLSGGATTTTAVVVWDPTNLTQVGMYTLAPQLYDSGGERIARASTLDIRVTDYPTL